MKRQFKIIEGQNKGFVHFINGNVVLVGRGNEANLKLKDPNVSKKHLEIRVEAAGVFVQDISSFGSLINGQKLTAEQSLNPGDKLEIGKTILQYDESDEEVERPVSELNQEISLSQPARTVVVPEFLKPREGQVVENHKTRRRGFGQTKLKNDLDWVAPTRERTFSKRIFLFALLALIPLAGLAYWRLRYQSSAAVGEYRYYENTGSSFGFNYPANWSKTSISTAAGSPSQLDFGRAGDVSWSRVTIYADKQPEYAVTGLSFGFNKYLETLKSQFKDFNLRTNFIDTLKEAGEMSFHFSARGCKGSGIFVFNGENRIVIECFCPSDAFDQFAEAFNRILGSFRLTTDLGYVNFPMPTDETRLLALNHRAELMADITNYMNFGQKCLDDSSVMRDGLYQSVQAYQKALQLIVSVPESLPEYETAANRLRESTSLYQAAVSRQRFAIERALKDGDRERAGKEALTLQNMVPQKTDPAYQYASKVANSLQK